VRRTCANGCWAVSGPATTRASRLDRQAAALVPALGFAWLLYTRLYFWLHPRRLTVAPSLFMHLTGRPDPLCGLTRTFAWMWQGDVARAAAAYPLGPVICAGSFSVLAYAVFVLVAGRVLQLRLPAGLRRGLVVTGLLLLALNWTAKFVWLGV
jgi:hypothetical protein